MSTNQKTKTNVNVIDIPHPPLSPHNPRHPPQHPPLNLHNHPTPLAHEHGLPQLAPFLGRPFKGQEGLKTYFNLLSAELSIENMVFEPDEEWVVDESCMAVCLRGSARFVAKGTGQGWDETFFYRIRIAEEGSAGDKVDGRGRLAVCEYQVWADTGAAYLARIGGLKGLLGEGEDVDLGFA
ncbi:hypothetical protein N7461_003475 [Penicillium sp. DV-2018c]|nr:hypothetical protein N7461_003475 [Penicillium sp. DV-2018c]